MLAVDTLTFGYNLKLSLGESGETNVRSFCDLIMAKVMVTPEATNVPKGGQGPEPRIEMLGGVNRMDMKLEIQERAAGIQNAGAGGPIVIGIVGEKHKFGKDVARGQDVAKLLRVKARPATTLVIEERRTKSSDYYSDVSSDFIYVREWDILGDMFHEPQRSAAMAAYACQAIGGGDQSKKNKVVVFFGENHIKDILIAFEHIILNCDKIPWLRFRQRVYYMFESQAK